MSFKPNFEVKIPKEYGPQEREAIARDIIDLIVERTESGKGVKDGALYSFPSYASKEYANLKGSSRPDLRLTGEMLESLRLVSEKNGLLKIGYSKSDSVAGKVEGNCIGSYGGEENPKLARNFLGITQGELDKVLKKYPVETKKEAAQKSGAIKTTAEEILDLLNLGFFSGP